MGNTVKTVTTWLFTLCVKRPTIGGLVAVGRAIVDRVSRLSLNHARAVDVVRQRWVHLSMNRVDGAHCRRILHGLRDTGLFSCDGVWLGKQCIDGEGFSSARFRWRYTTMSASIVCMKWCPRAHRVSANGSKRPGRKLHVCWMKVSPKSKEKESCRRSLYGRSLVDVGRSEVRGMSGASVVRPRSFYARLCVEVWTGPHRAFVFQSSRWEKPATLQGIQLTDGVVTGWDCQTS